MGIFSNTWRHIRRSPYQAFAAISVMTLTFLVAGLFFILSIGSAIVLSYFEQKPQIIVFFKDTKSEAEIKTLAEKLESSPKVAGVKYVSKEEALTLYKQQFKNDPLLLEMVSADILPASIEVSAVRIDFLSELARELKNETEVEEIVYQEDVVNLLVSWTNAVRQIGIVLVVFLGLVALFTVVTVISMKIALRQDEIEILQLVGATSGYVRGPFLTEGVIYGFVGAVVAAGVNISLLIYATPFMTKLFAGIPLFPVPLLFYLIFTCGMAICGMILGMLASIVAVNRYIR